MPPDTRCCARCAQWQPTQPRERAYSAWCAANGWRTTYDDSCKAFAPIPLVVPPALTQAAQALWRKRDGD